jgi:Protein of unknown function (DUF2563)
MFVDTELLRSGAEFSRSAGTTAQQGAVRLSSAQLPAKMFGDFAAAEDFRRTLGQAHETHVSSMQGYQTELTGLADTAHSAAALFMKQDEESASTLHASGRNFTGPE